MKNIDHLSDEEIRKLFSKPLSKEAAKQLLEVDRADRGLLAENLNPRTKKEVYDATS